MQKKTLAKYLILLVIALGFSVHSIYSVQKQKADLDKEDFIIDDINNSSKNSSIAIEEPEIILDSYELQDNNENDVGVATLSIKDKTYRYAIILRTNDPENEKIYKAWLAVDTPKKGYLLLGQLDKSEEAYRLDYRTQDKNDYSKIIISQETKENSNQKPSQILFTSVARLSSIN